MRLGAALLLLLFAAGHALAQGGSCDSCNKPAKVGLNADGCSGNNNFSIRVADSQGTDRLGLSGSGNCSADSWMQTEQGYIDMEPDATYQLRAEGGSLCAVHINFFLVPDGYKLEIDGKETTTVDEELSVDSDGVASNYPMNHVWNVVLRKKGSCADKGAGEGGARQGSVVWGVGLGSISDGRSAQSISLREEFLWDRSYTPAALIYSPPAGTSEVDVVRNAEDNSLRQVKAPETLADVVVISSWEYEVRFYRPSDVGAKTDGVYAVSGQPYVVWKIKNPDPPSANSLQISKTQNGITDTSTYNWDENSDVWSLTTGDGARVETKTTTYPTANSRTETSVVKNALQQVVSKVSRTFYAFDWGEELVQIVSDPDGAALKTTYAFYQNAADASRYARLKSVTNPDGSWEKYDYDQYGNRSLVLRPWKDQPLSSATEANSHATYYTYSNFDGVTASLYAKLISGVTEKVAGVTVGKTAYGRSGATLDGEPVVTEVRTDYASASLTQTTTTTTYHSSASASLAGRVVSVIYPDGRKDTYTYEKGDYTPNVDPSLSQFTPDPNGLALREGVTHGTASSPGGVALHTTKEYAVRDQYGHAVLQEAYVFNGSAYERIAWSVMDYNDRGQLVYTHRHDGRDTSSTWVGDKRSSDTDGSGVQTTYAYDSLGRVQTRTKKGVAASGTFPAQPDIVTTFSYDAEGQQTGASSSAGGLAVSNSSSYDMAGRLKSETDQAGLTTTYAYANGGRTRTVTLPGGATRVTDSYLDGRSKSETGTAVIAQTFDYGVNGDGSQYTKVFSGSAGLASPRWQKTTTDWLGRTVLTESPSFAGADLIVSSTYNSKGQLQSQSSSAGAVKVMADKLYEYDALGNPARTGLDLDGDGVLSPLSDDRINEAETSYDKTGSDWFRVDASRTYLTNGSDAGTTRVSRERLTNFATNGTQKTFSDVTMTDPAGNSTRVTSAVDRAAKKVTKTTDTPDSNVDAVEVEVNGLAQSSTPTRPESATTYAYDALGRPVSVTTPKSGTATKTYSATTGQLTSEGDSAQTATYEYYPAAHANAGRLKSRTDINGKKTYLGYNSRGELTQTWGDSAYPLEYVYDAYGQRTELHTFRAGKNWGAGSWPGSTAGAADVTTWVYNEPTGLLERKQDAAAKQVVYTYDSLGRVSTRLWARTAAPLTTYSYDPLTGELTGIDYSDSTPDVTYGYDRGGRQTSITDAAGTHARAFNLRGELQADQIGGGLLDTVHVTANFDQYERVQSLQASRGASALTTQTYGYDAASRMGTVTNNGRSATYAYYPSTGFLNTTTFTGGAQTSRGYDSLGRLQSIATSAPAPGTVASYAYTYNSLHQRTKVTREDGSYWSYSYDDRGELVSGKKYWADGTPVWGQQTEYTFDNIGNRGASKSGGNPLGGLRQSSYVTNALNQYVQRSAPGALDVTGAAVPEATVMVNDQSTDRKGDYFYKELQVDNAATPVYQQVNVVGARANYGEGGEDAVTQQGGRAFVPQATVAYTYDADGNLTQDGRWSYSWDGENRLVSMEALPAVPVEAKQRLEFAYDSTGRRIQKKVYNWDAAANAFQLASVTKFVYYEWSLLAELDGGGALVRSYVWGQDLSGSQGRAGGVGGLLFVNEGAESYFVAPDGSGNVGTLLKSSDGTVAASYDYDPFGNTLKAVGEYAARNPFRCSTKYADVETGLVYYGYRYYDPQTGRWSSRDPQGESGGVNLYAFVSNNPANRFDALGLRPISFAFVAFINGRRGDWLPEPGNTFTGYEFNTNKREFGQFDPNNVRTNGKIFTYGSIESDRLGDAVLGKGLNVTVDTGLSERRATPLNYGPDEPELTSNNKFAPEEKKAVAKRHIEIDNYKESCYTIIDIDAAAAYPFISGSPDIDFDIRLTFRKEGGKIFVSLDGSHNRFPDYEAYLDGELMYTYFSPDSGPGFFNLGVLSMAIGKQWKVIDNR